VNERASVLITAREAAAVVEPGDTVAIGGILNSCHPMPVVRELIRRGVGDLHVVSIAGGPDIDLLIAAGLVRRLSTPEVTGESLHPGAAPAFRRAAERGEIEVWECDEGIIQVALQAAAERVPFAPWPGGMGTSLPEINDGMEVIESPYGGQRVVAVRALPVDVTFMHAARSDRHGNVQVIGSGMGDKALARASQRVFCTVERIVGNEEIRRDPRATTIPGADGVVHAPFGAHPFASPGHYVADEAGIRSYLDAARQWQKTGDRQRLDAWLGEWVTGPEDHWAYLARVGPGALYALEEGLWA
jgi:glutaconate CoA-transferase subunit A